MLILIHCRDDELLAQVSRFVQAMLTVYAEESGAAAYPQQAVAVAGRAPRMQNLCSQRVEGCRRRVVFKDAVTIARDQFPPGLSDELIAVAGLFISSMSAGRP